MKVQVGDRVKVGKSFGIISLIVDDIYSIARYHIVFDDKSRAWFYRRQIVLRIAEEKVIFT